MAETLQVWQWEVMKQSYDCLVTPIFHSLKDDGMHVSYNEVIRWTSKNSRATVLTTQDYAVEDQGVVGALVVFGEEHGCSAGRIVNNILKNNLKGGPSPPRMTKRESSISTSVNWTGMVFPCHSRFANTSSSSNS